MDFDVRVWNIVAGLGVIVGCTERTFSRVDTNGDAGDGEGTSGSVDTQETPPECVTSDDCLSGDKCVNGMCYYYGPGDDGAMYWSCDEDFHCDFPYGICEDYYCVFLDPPPPACMGKEIGLFPIPTAGALRLSFVDLDDDGRDELAVATQDELHVFEDLAGPPSVSARDPSVPITAMTAGHFDAEPGEDLMLLLDDQLQVFSSNGIEGFVSTAPTPAPVSLPVGLLAGDFDGIPPTDLLVWGGSALLISNGGEYVEFESSPLLPIASVQAAAAFDLGSPPGAIALRDAWTMYVHALDGTLLMAEPYVGSPNVVSLSDGDTRFVTWRNHNGGIHVRHWPSRDWLNGPQTYFTGTPFAATSADLDGDSHGDLVYLGDGSRVAIHFDLLGLGCRMEVQVAGPPVAAAVGDLDGDGDDEVALQLFDGSVTVISVM